MLLLLFAARSEVTKDRAGCKPEVPSFHYDYRGSGFGGQGIETGGERFCGKTAENVRERFIAPFELSHVSQLHELTGKLMEGVNGCV